MSIHGEVSFDKEGKAVRFAAFRRVFVPLAVVLVGLLGYGLGRLSGAGERPPVKIEYDPNIVSALGNGQASIPNSQSSSTGAMNNENSGAVYASSKGTKYYYMSCKSTVSAANKITFASAAAAEAAGYTLSITCHQ